RCAHCPHAVFRRFRKRGLTPALVGVTLSILRILGGAWGSRGGVVLLVGILAGGILVLLVRGGLANAKTLLQPLDLIQTEVLGRVRLTKIREFGNGLTV